MESNLSDVYKLIGPTKGTTLNEVGMIKGIGGLCVSS